MIFGGHMEIGTKIRQRRKALNMRQSDLAQMLSVATATISKWEKGYISPERERMPELARVLEVELEYFGITIDPAPKSEVLEAIAGTHREVKVQSARILKNTEEILAVLVDISGLPVEQLEPVNVREAFKRAKNDAQKSRENTLTVVQQSASVPVYGSVAAGMNAGHSNCVSADDASMKRLSVGMDILEFDAEAYAVCCNLGYYTCPWLMRNDRVIYPMGRIR